MKFALLCKTNKEKYTEIFPPLLLCAMPRSKKGSNFKEDDRALPLFRCYYSMEERFHKVPQTKPSLAQVKCGIIQPVRV